MREIHWKRCSYVIFQRRRVTILLSNIWNDKVREEECTWTRSKEYLLSSSLTKYMNNNWDEHAIYIGVLPTWLAICSLMCVVHCKVHNCTYCISIHFGILIFNFTKSGNKRHNKIRVHRQCSARLYRLYIVAVLFEISCAILGNTAWAGRTINARAEDYKASTAEWRKKDRGKSENCFICDFGCASYVFAVKLAIRYNPHALDPYCWLCCARNLRIIHKKLMFWIVNVYEVRVTVAVPQPLCSFSSVASTYIDSNVRNNR